MKRILFYLTFLTFFGFNAVYSKCLLAQTHTQNPHKPSQITVTTASQSENQNTWIWQKLLELVLIPFIVGIGSSSVVVFFGVKSIKDYIRDNQRKKELGELKLFWSNNNDNCREKYHIIVGIESSNQHEEIEPRLIHSQAFGLFQIQKFLENLYEGNVDIEFHWLEKKQNFDDRVFEDNVILIGVGGDYSLKNSGHFCQIIKIPYKIDFQNRDFIIRKENDPVETLNSIVENNSLKRAIGTVVRLVNHKNNKLIIIFDGTYGVGTFGAILCTTETSKFNGNGFDREKRAQQLITIVEGITNNILNLKITNSSNNRNWVAVDITSQDLERAILVTSEKPRSGDQSKSAGTQPAKLANSNIICQNCHQSNLLGTTVCNYCGHDLGVR